MKGVLIKVAGPPPLFKHISSLNSDFARTQTQCHNVVVSFCPVQCFVNSVLVFFSQAVTGRCFGDRDFRGALENGILLCE